MRIARAQCAALMRTLDPSGRKALPVEVSLGEVEIRLGEDFEAQDARRSPPRAFEHDAMMAALLHRAQTQRLFVLERDPQAERVDVKRLARRQIGDGQFDVAQP
jgi:hypothetical protein